MEEGVEREGYNKRKTGGYNNIYLMYIHDHCYKYYSITNYDVIGVKGGH